MKNTSPNTKQNATVKQTLSIEEFIKKYIISSEVDIKNLKFFSFNLKKALKDNKWFFDAFWNSILAVTLKILAWKIYQ